jgi:hypothetical protein
MFCKNVLNRSMLSGLAVAVYPVHHWWMQVSETPSQDAICVFESRLCCKFVVEAKRIQSFGLSSCFLGKEAENEITEQTRFFGLSCLSFADHVNGFVTGNRAPGAPKGTKPLTGSAPAFDGPMILFEDVVEVLHRTVLTLLG